MVDTVREKASLSTYTINHEPPFPKLNGLKTFLEKYNFRAFPQKVPR
jgi:hypothetical protein